MSRSMRVLWMKSATALALLIPDRSWSEPAIADNSFLIEEAYNQERGVVQHVLTVSRRAEEGDDMFSTFTQEWPFPAQTHQLSFTLTYVGIAESDQDGIGDLLLNYRRQFGGEGRWAAAPRASIVLALGDSNAGGAADETGLQGNIPVSIELTPNLVTHLNAGVEWFPDLTSPFLGASLISPVEKQVNLLLEALVSFPAEIDEDGDTHHPRETTLSPGIRAAINAGGVQIVPGFAVPTTWREGESDSQLFFYLSVEHSFTGS
jgi:hypothetical protein